MDIFRILSRGAALKNSKKATADFTLPEEHKPKARSVQDEVERETDFFKTGKRSAPPDGDTESKAGQSDNEDDAASDSEVAIIQTAEDAEKFRLQSNSKVEGSDVPLPIGSFQDLVSRFDLSKKLRQNLLNDNFVEPTPIQCEAIPVALSHRDLIAAAPTGSGKTIAFVLPMLQTLLDSAQARGGAKNSAIRGLIIAPTNELALQIHHQLQALAKGIKALSSAVLSRALASRLQQDLVSASKYAILVSTPMRLIELVKSGHVDLSSVQELVIDEADRLLDHGFVEQTDTILAELKHPSLRKSIYSATIPRSVEDLAQSIMKDHVRIVVGLKNAASSTIDQKLVFTGSEDGKLVAIRQMIQHAEFKPPVIIFLQSVERAKALFHEMLYDKLNVDVIHSDKTPAQRDDVIKRFKNGDIWVLITTDVLARGVDFKGVNLVINYDVPQTAQAYVHRIGRTGRGGKQGKAVTFFTKEDRHSVKPIISVMKRSGSTGYSSWMENSKLSRNEGRRVRTQVISRKEISTEAKIFKQKEKRKREMIEGSKRRKAKKLAAAKEAS